MFDYRNTDKNKIDYLENQSTGALAMAGLIVLASIEEGNFDQIEGQNQLNDILMAIATVS